MADETAEELLAQLVAFPTIAGTSNLEFMAFVAERLEASRARVSILPGMRPDARNLHGVLGPAEAHGGLLLAAHSDVVAVQGQPWTRDPFTLTRQGDRLYGRGTADMKGFIAALLAAVSEIDARTLRRPLHIAVSSDEELGCIGVPPLLDALAALDVPPAYAVVGEPTSLRVAVKHKGKAAVRIHLTGRAAHSSLAPTGVNAVAYAGRVISELLALQDDVAADDRDDAFTVPYATIGIGPIAGGVSMNIVPDSCQLDVEVRSLPGHDPVEIMARIAALASRLEREMRSIAPEASIEFEPLSAYPGLEARTDDGFAKRIAALSKDDCEPAALDFGTEAGLYQRRLGIPVVVCGPGSMRQAHRADEYLKLADIQAAHEFLKRLLLTSPDSPDD